MPPIAILISFNPLRLSSPEDFVSAILTFASAFLIAKVSRLAFSKLVLVIFYKIKIEFRI